MNFKVDLFFHLYETHITPLGIPILTVMGWVPPKAIMGNKQVCLPNQDMELK